MNSETRELMDVRKLANDAVNGWGACQRELATVTAERDRMREALESFAVAEEMYPRPGSLSAPLLAQARAALVQS